MKSTLFFKKILFSPAAERILVFTFLLALSFYTYGDYLYKAPRNNHLWAQTDRACIAKNYYENGLNFFKPQVCNQGETDGTTGTELPLLYFLSAIFMKIFNSDSPFFVRFFSLIFSISGLSYLYSLARYIHLNRSLGILGILIVYFSPIFFFYQANFNSNHVAFGLSSASFYYLVRYIYERNFKYMYFFNFLSALSLFVKASFGLYFISGNIIFYLITNRNYKLLFKQYIYTSLIALMYFINYRYIIYLNEKNKSHFFTISIENFESFKNAILETGHILSFWLHDIIFSWVYILILLMIFIVGTFSNITISKSKFILSTLVFFGSLSVYFLMGKQYQIHDYYFIEIIYIPLFLFFICISYNLQKILQPRVINILSIVLVTFLFLSGKQAFSERTTIKNDKRDDWLVRDFENSSPIFDKIGIPKSEKIIVFDGWCPNAIFYYTKRNGICIDFMNPETLNLWKGRGYKHLIVENCSFTSLPERIAEGIPHMNLKYDSNKFKVYELK
jgi:hypothetical protein